MLHNVCIWCFVVIVLLMGRIEGRDLPRIWGVNIHYTKGRDGESLQLSQGYRIARMDFAWGGIERVKNQYDFSAYEQLYTELHSQPNPVACYWILDYGNPLYDGGDAPHTEAGIQAFVNFAVASLKHFVGRGIIWEMWNEPNGGFWHPAANATAYSILATAVGSAIRGNSEIKNEIYVGPATSGVDLAYLETTFQHGVLNYFDAVSVHPYRGGGPESVLSEYDNVKKLIQKYGGKDIPILSGEWGWSTCVAPCTPGWPAIINEQVQAEFLSRQWMINTLASVPISIYYDYINDGPDPTYREENFGTLRNQYLNSSEPHEPKPAYKAAVYLQKNFADLKYSTRVTTTDPDSYILAFTPTSSNVDTTYAIWKTSGTPSGTCDSVVAPVDCGFFGITQQQCIARGCCFKIPAPPDGPQCYYLARNTTGNIDFRPVTPGCFSIHDVLGNIVTSKVCTTNGSINLVVSDNPIYLNRISSTKDEYIY